MTTNPDRWTADDLLNQNHIGIYTEQVLTALRQMAEDFRALGLEVRDACKAEPPAGDNNVQAHWHARQLSRPLLAMEADMRAAMGQARKLEATYRRLYIDLPRNRQAKELARKQQESLTARTADRLNAAARTALAPADQDEPAPEQAAAPVLNLFDDDKVRKAQ